MSAQQKFRYVVLFILSFTLTALVTAAPVRLFLEAEDCTGLLRYPYDNEAASGWYAREADTRGVGAPGRAYCAAIHEPATNRTMTQKLTAPLPAGKYRLFLRTIGPRSADTNTIVRIGLGQASTDITWPDGKKRFVWNPGVDITLTAPAETVSFTAVRFGGRSYGACYEPLSRSIWVDTLYITSDPNETNEPALDAERALRAGRDPTALPPRPTYTVDFARTPKPVKPAVTAPLLLTAFDGRKNLWPNSSFELGMNDGWAATPAQHVITDKDLDSQKAMHGQYSLRIPATHAFFSRPYYLKEGGEMCLSLHAQGAGTVSFTLKQIKPTEAMERDKTSGLGIDGKSDVETEGAIGGKGVITAEWTRLNATGKLTPGWYYLTITAAEETRVDAIQLERGGQTTPYAPCAELEGALRSGQLANIIYEPQKTLIAWFHNSGAKSQAARLKYRVTDVREKVVAEDVTEPIQVAAGATVKKELPLLPGLRGPFSITCAVEGRELPESELVCLVMPPPATQPTRHAIGACLSPNPGDVAVNSRLGLKWLMDCKNRQFAAANESVQPAEGSKPETWHWFDDDAKRPKQYGMDQTPAFWPSRTMPWMNQKVDPLQYRTARGGKQEGMPKPDVWSTYVGAIANHYKDSLTWWQLDDEPESSRDPKLYAKVVQATIDGLKGLPDIKLAGGGGPEFNEELFRYVKPDDLQFFAASTFDFPYWYDRYVRRLGDQYQKPWFCNGVGGRVPATTLYHTHYNYRTDWWKSAWYARSVVKAYLGQNVKVFGHYAGILHNSGGHIGLNKPLCDYDATPLPVGATFGCLGTLLADAESLGEVELGQTGLRVYVFQIGQKLGAATWSTSIPLADKHHKPSVRLFKAVSLSCGEGTLSALDMYWNPLEGAAWKNGRLVFDLGEEPTFLLTDKLTREALFDSLKQATVAPPEVDIRMALKSGANGRPDLNLTIKNNTAQPLAECKADFRTSPSVAYSTIAGDNLLATPYQVVGDVPAGAEKTCELATLLDGKLPFENGYLQVVLTDRQGREFAAEDWIWLLPAHVAASVPVLDGRLTEWETRSAAWLAYAWDWVSFSRWSLVNLAEGGENFGYPIYSLDARAAFWAAHDEKNLYLAIRLEDDQPVLGDNGERVKITLAGTAGQPAELVLRPKADGTCSANLTKGKDAAEPMQAKATASKNAVMIEAAVPWSALGGKPASGSLLGFDLSWTDVDPCPVTGKPLSGTMRWAGGSSLGGYLLVAGK